MSSIVISVSNKNLKMPLFELIKQMLRNRLAWKIITVDKNVVLAYNSTFRGH
jgi:hypothetical protein